MNINKCFESFYSGNNKGVQNIKGQKIMVRSDAGTVVQFKSTVMVVLQIIPKA